MKNLKIKFILSIFFSVAIFLFPVFYSVSFAETLEEQLARLEKEIQEKSNEISQRQTLIDKNQYLIGSFNSQISNLAGQIQNLESEIAKINLEIQTLQISLELLEKQIEENKKEIQEITDAVKLLRVESKDRLESSYINFRMYGGEVDAGSLIKSNVRANFFKDSQYKELIQSDTNYLLINLNEKTLELEKAKKDLDEKFASLEKDKALIELKRKDVDIAYANLQTEKNLFYLEQQKLQAENSSNQSTILVLSEEEAKKSAEAENVRNALFNSFTPVSSGEYIATGRPIGKQGCTGLCTGPHLHFMVWENGYTNNPCGYISICGGSRLEMPIRASVVVTSYYGNRCFYWNGNYCDFHNGLDMQANPTNSAIYSAHSGYVFKGTDQYGALYVIVCESSNCSSGIKTGYWHLSSF